MTKIENRETSELDGLNTWLEVSRAAYLHNLALFRRLVGPEVELSAVVKANAYGHGWLQIAELAREGGANSFCVHALEEALRLRGAGFQQDILVMGHIPLARLAEAVHADLRLVLYNRESAEELARVAAQAGKPARVHLKVETGTYRQGIDEAELPGFLDLFAAHPELRLEGVYTHFANIEDTTDHSYARAQLASFELWTARLAEAGHGELVRHTACSAATLLFPQTHFEMVRLGISQYGIWSSKETFLSYRLKLGGTEISSNDILRPVLTWKARVSQIKAVPAGAYVGYGCTYQTTRDSRLAILPVGYSDGYDRHLSSRAHVLIRGRRAPVRGRVCMNLTLVDVTDIPDAALEDEAVLLGRQGEQEVSAADLAGWVGTIPYEILARIRAEIRRVVAD